MSSKTSTGVEDTGVIPTTDHTGTPSPIDPTTTLIDPITHMPTLTTPTPIGPITPLKDPITPMRTVLTTPTRIVLTLPTQPIDPMRTEPTPMAVMGPVSG